MGDTFYPPQRQHRQTEMRVLRTAVVLVLVASVSPAPQWDGLKSLVKNLSGDDQPGEVNGDYEQVPYEVLAKLNGYEERKYPSVMYACTEMTYDTPDDEEGEEWSLEKVMRWMTNKKSWKERPQSKMFMRLFRYIAGVNKESQEIEMTVPVWSKMVVSQEDGKITKDMCFYITKEFQSNPPEPTDPEVKVLKSKERIVFVKQFGGYAMQDSVWMREAEKFRAELAERGDEVEQSYFWTAGYDSPMKFWNRRNEVAFEKTDSETEKLRNDVI